MSYDKIKEITLCSKCHKEPAEWDDLCQTCFEEYCNNEWWEWYDLTKGIFCQECVA